MGARCSCDSTRHSRAVCSASQGTGIELLGQVLSVNFAFVRGNQGR